MSIQIEIKRAGFPVKLGEVELWFDTSLENLTRFFDFNDEVAKRFNDYQKELIERSNNGEFDNIKEGIVDKQVADEALALEKKATEIKYDVLFGDGTFNKLYEVYPSYEALDKAFEEVDTLIGAELEKMAIERKKNAVERATNYKAKTKSKRVKNARKK